ncbi:MAG: KEOPS complex subunit Pcc1 [Sulfolobales archaeon]|nr:KEOPS complex subunit Pcc1 [Sulfolobales archaeon]
MRRAEISFKFDSGELALAVFKSLYPESRVSLRNVRVRVELSGSEVAVVVDADDESALRATLNSLIKLTYLVVEILKVR